MHASILFLSLSCAGRCNLSIYNKSLPAMLLASQYAQEGVPNSAISAPKLADFLLHLFRVGLAWHMFGTNGPAFSALMELHHHHKASSHLIISKLIFYFYLQCHLHINGLIHGMSNVYYPC